MILVISNFIIFLSKYFFIKIIMRFGFFGFFCHNLGQDLFLFYLFYNFYEICLLYGKLAAVYKFKHKCLTLLPIVHA